MRLRALWISLAVAHLAAVFCLAIALIFLAYRLGQHSVAVKADSVDGPVSAEEIGRLNLVSDRIALMENNLANADTVGFKRQCVWVEDGAQPKISDDRIDMSQGSLQSTGNPLDVAIEGEGFFRVKVNTATTDAICYTRVGSFFRNRDGAIALGMGGGYPIVPPITIPPSGADVGISSDGMVSYMPTGSTQRQIAGQLQLCTFADPQHLHRTDGFFTATEASGEAICSKPGESGRGNLIQGYLESSNVDPVKEWAGIRKAQRLLQFRTRPDTSTPKRQLATLTN